MNNYIIDMYSLIKKDEDYRISIKDDLDINLLINKIDNCMEKKNKIYEIVPVIYLTTIIIGTIIYCCKLLYV